MNVISRPVCSVNVATNSSLWNERPIPEPIWSYNATMLDENGEFIMRARNVLPEPITDDGDYIVGIYRGAPIQLVTEYGMWVNQTNVVYGAQPKAPQYYDLPYHYELNTMGDISFYYEWKERIGFSGKPVRLEIYELAAGGYIWFNNIKSFEDCYTLSEDVAEGDIKYRLEFEFESDSIINLHISYLDANRSLISEQDIIVTRSIGIELRSYELSPPAGTKNLDIYFRVDSTLAPVNFTVCQIRVNEVLCDDILTVTETVSNFAIDRILRSYPEYYEISLNSLLYNTNVAIAREMDIIKATLFTIFNYFFVDYACKDRLDSFGLLLDEKRRAGEYDTNYRLRIKAKLISAFGGGIFAAIKRLLALYTRGSDPQLRSLWTYNESTYLYEPLLEIYLPPNCRRLIPDNELLSLVLEITLVGIPIAIVTDYPGEYDIAEYDISKYGVRNPRGN